MKINRKNILLLLVFALLFVLIVYKLNDFSRQQLISTKGQSYETGVITEITRDNLAEDGNRYGNQEVMVEITSGARKGEFLSAISPGGELFGAACTVGMHVIVSISSTDSNYVTTIYSQNRQAAIWIFVAVFATAVILVGGRKGIMSLIGLAFAIVCILWVLFPAVYRGVSPILMAIVISALTSIVMLGLLNGFSKKTISAMTGTCAGVAFSGIAAVIFGHFAGISGHNVSDIETLNFVAQYCNLHIGQLLFAGIIIASLGAVMDVGISVASALDEIHAVNPSLTRKQLFASGMHIGQDMIGTMSHTLILAFVGGSLTTLLINYAYNLSYNQLMNSYNIGIEIMQGLAGSLGVVLTVPVTSFVSSILLSKSPVNNMEKNPDPENLSE